MEFNCAVREPTASVSGTAMLVLLHGYGADERDLMGLSPALDPSLRILSLRAPHTTPMGGYAWFGIEFDTSIRSYDIEQAESSLAALVEFLGQLREEVLGRLVLAGFSQGAMMALAAVAHKPALADAVALLSARVLPPLVPSTAPAGLSSVPFLVQHGAFDPLIEVACGREIDALLDTWGVEHEYLEYPMGHEISAQSLDDFARWIRSQLGEPAG